MRSQASASHCTTSRPLRCYRVSRYVVYPPFRPPFAPCPSRSPQARLLRRLRRAALLTGGEVTASMDLMQLQRERRRRAQLHKMQDKAAWGGGAASTAGPATGASEPVETLLAPLEPMEPMEQLAYGTPR
jgi:hypothetical protein